MNGKRLAATELLMSYPDTVVAEMLGIRMQTLARWMQDQNFAEALRAREREQVRSIARIARQAALRAAAMLCQIAADQTRPDAKVMLEIVKASGAFDAEQENPGQSLVDIIKLAGSAVEVDDDSTEE